MPVWEVEGAEFTVSPVHTANGISIRFPRLTGFRDDKDWQSATSLAELVELVKASKPAASGGKADMGDSSDTEPATKASSKKKKDPPSPKPPAKKQKKIVEDDVPSSPEPLKKKQKRLAEDEAPSSPPPKVQRKKDTGDTTTTTTTKPDKKKKGGNNIIPKVGDVFTDTEEESNIVIAHLADDAGKWGKKGVFGAISSRWSKVVDKYEGTKPLHVGDCILTKVDGKKYIASLIGQKIQHSLVPATFKPADFEKAVTKLASLAKHKGLNTVYFVHPDSKIPNMDIVRVEKALNKNLAKEGLTTYLYPIFTDQGGSNGKDKGKEKEKEKDKEKEKGKDKGKEKEKDKGKSKDTGKDTKAKDKGKGNDEESKKADNNKADTKNGKADSKDSSTKKKHSANADSFLPDVFNDLTFHIHPSIPDCELLHRYIIAYGGTIESPGVDTSHLIVLPEHLKDCAEIIEESPDVCIVSHNWAWDCINTEALRGVEQYRLK